jgi:hypothetical protein
VSKIFKFILFADDTNLFCSDGNLDNLLVTANIELKKLCDWFSINRLSLNVLKTNYMLFKKSKQVSNVELFMNNCKINRVHVTKFLGVMMDENLNWKEHISYVKTKISKNIAVLYRARKLFCENVIRTLYCSLILPYMTYCIEVWGNTYKTNLNSLVLLQKKAIRIISGAAYLDHTNNIFLNFKLLKFMDLVELNTLLVMHKAYNNLLPLNLQKCFSVDNVATFSTRRKNKFKINYVRTNMKAMCISIRGVKMWNALDFKLSSCSDIKLFKRDVKNYYFEKYELKIIA